MQLRLTRILIVFSLSVVNNYSIISAVKTEDVDNKCQNECGISLLTQPGDGFGVHCNDTCRIELCTLGCQQWQEAVRIDNCWNVCSKHEAVSDNSIKQMACVLGCRYAGSLYVQNVKDEVGIPLEPCLVADSRTNTSVRIKWEGANKDVVPLNVSYLLQWKYDSLPGSWEYYRPKVPIVDTVHQVDGLTPYTRYRFRVSWIILPEHEPLTSKESIVISTLPYGVPSSSPIITSLTLVDFTRVSVTWEPPLFPNGPILSYVVNLSHADFSLIKDISEPKDNFFIFNNLKPSATYTISVSCRNNVGEGPKALQSITTPKKPHAQSTPDPFLILSTRHKVEKHRLELLSESLLLYKPKNQSIKIQGLAIHFQKNCFFLSDSEGDIHRVPIRQSPEDSLPTGTIITPANLHSRPQSLSIDWLNNKLYLIEEHHISRCDLDGRNYEIVVTGFDHLLSDMKVDPYNGYLYWVTKSVKGGLYQIDLGDLGQGSVVNRDSARLLISDDHLVTFAIDHRNFRLFLPNDTENTVYVTHLNGLERINIRKNTQQSRFSGVKAIAVFKDLFYWATDNGVWYEEYHEQDQKFYHNEFYRPSVSKEPLFSLHVFHPDSQPIPAPVNPVRNLQAVFKEVMTKLSWLPPVQLGGLGRGSWQKWNYEILVEDLRNKSSPIIQSNLTKLTYSLEGLTESTDYAIKVRAYSPGGKGPWSDVFKGRTLRPAARPGFPQVLWSAEEGIFKSDIIGDNVELLIHGTNLQNAHIIDMAWYQDVLFLNTNTSRIYVYNMSYHESLTLLPEAVTGVSIAVDWIGKKIYWSSPKQQMILRSNLDGKNIEPLLILTIAKELNIDSLNGFIYWTTSHSVECARLNGGGQRTYFQTGFFSGEKVMGLTLDLDRQIVYWIVWRCDGARVYNSTMASYSNNELVTENDKKHNEHLVSLPDDTIHGPLRYYSGHLYWLHDQNEALISDTCRMNVAHLRGLGLRDLKTLIVIDPTLQPLPDVNMTHEIVVIPNQVNENTITVSGHWNNFNITWSPVTNVNYGTVYYEITVDDQIAPKIQLNVSELAHYSYPSASSLPPYSPLLISIRAFTYWGSSRLVSKSLRSPMSVSTKPIKPRAFVTYHKDAVESLHRTEPKIQIEFRWQPPKHPNGVVLGYKVTSWSEHNTGIGNSTTHIFENETSDLFFRFDVPKSSTFNASYFFKVRAYNEAGEGPSSKVVEAKTSYEIPIPKLFVAQGNSLELTDVDNKERRMIMQDAVHAVDIDYLWDNVFWLGQDGTLMRANMDGSNKTKVKDLQSFGTSLSVDWVGRKIYWSEVDEMNSSFIWKLDVDHPYDPTPIIQSFGRIGSLKVEPLSSMLFWTTEFRDGLGCLFASDMDGSKIRSFFSNVNHCTSRAFKMSGEQQRRYGRDAMVATANETDIWEEHTSDVVPLIHQSDYCNCPRDLLVSFPLALDNSNVSSIRLLWVEADKGHIWMSDLKGCRCTVILNATKLANNGLPPTSLTVDRSQIYWCSRNGGYIYSVPKPAITYRDGTLVDVEYNRRHVDVNTISLENVSAISSIMAIGDHLQPYPDQKCLEPQNYVDQPTVVTSSSTSVILSIKPVSQSPECSNVSLASITYTLYYYPVTDRSAKTGAEQHFCNGAIHTPKINASSTCFTLSTRNTTVTLRGLVPYTNYTVRVSARNYYSPVTVKAGPRFSFNTSEGVPSEPQNVTVIVTTPESACVTWITPKSINGPAVVYSIHWKRHIPNSDMQSNSRSLPPVSQLDLNALHNASVGGLKPAQNYSVTIRANPTNGRGFSESAEVFVQTFQIPNNLSLIMSNLSSISLKWVAPTSCEILEHKLLYEELFGNRSSELQTEITEPGKYYQFNITTLQPNTRYVFRLLVLYNSSFPTTYIWPKGTDFIFATAGDRPTSPGIPEAVRVQQDVYKVTWEQADSRGGKHTYYILQVLPWNENYTGLYTVNSDWTNVYNGSETKWTVSKLDTEARYTFRVRAINEFGISDFSEESHAINFSQIPVLGDNEERLTIVLGSTLSLVIIAMMVSFYIVFKVRRTREKNQKVLQEMVLNLRTSDAELATLRDLPNHHNFIHQTNAIYSSGDVISDAELASLPRINRNQIILIKFLGSGAFGEVFEGLARNLPGADEESTPVAIKTLRKGATDQEKAEFLKEAQLMSNFKHEHILHLLGVCLNNDPNFIILELMEGGDLLSYLRSHRPTVFSTSSLTIQDLISICVDVAKGCRYLEEMHFVHRDLAARNCLVSSHDAAHRVVKIGDFGLARDIYKNDYYRKEGEGLLPVRWMSPESLVDGVFTSQSDVWAFGVLLWEVMTLGQQPYPARTNVEVLHYVRGRGHLDKPDNCPDDLHHLMMRCWSYNPCDRPTFKYCLEQLQELKRKSADLLPTTVHNRNYLGKQGGIDNLAYNCEEVFYASSPVSSEPQDDQSCLLAGINRDSVRGRHQSARTLLWSTTETDNSSGINDMAEDRNNSSRRATNSINSNRLLSDTDTDDKTVLLDDEGNDSPTGTHKYLELLYDSDEHPEPENNGYEVPLPANKLQRGSLCLPNNQTTNGNDESEKDCDDTEFLPPSWPHIPVMSNDSILSTLPVVDESNPKSGSERVEQHSNLPRHTIVGQPLLRSPELENLDHSPEDADSKIYFQSSLRAFGGGGGDNRSHKAISDSAPLLQDPPRNTQSFSNFQPPTTNIKKRPVSSGALPGELGDRRQCMTLWKNSSMSLEDSADDASNCSSPISPGYRSSNMSGVSVLSAHSCLSPSSSSSSTSGIEIDCETAATDW